MHRISSAWKLVAPIALLAILLGGTSYGQPATPDDTAAPSSPPEASSVSESVTAAQGLLRFIPAAANGVVPNTVFGVEMLDTSPAGGIDRAGELGPAWIRLNGLLWKYVEPTEGRGYTWTNPYVALIEGQIRYANERNLQPILVIRGSPRWATAPYQADCGPINPTKYGRYAAFLDAVVKRYSQPPYNVRYIELGNEPDAPIGIDSVYGCWGDKNDQFFGGGAYGNMLKAVYPAVKAANPAVKLLNGSVLLERDNVPMAKFMEGILRSGAGNSFDILGFHSYCMFDYNNVDGHDVYFRSCANDWKVTFLRDLLRKYGLPDKPMFRTEAGLLCSAPVAPTCRQHQADFIARYYARTARDNIIGSIWFLLDSDAFQNSGLLEPGNPKVGRPAFAAAKQAAMMFGGARYISPLANQAAGVEGHRFVRNDETITVVWSNRQQSASVPVDPSASLNCYGRDGQVLACASAGGVVTLTAGPGPTYVVTR